MTLSPPAPALLIACLCTRWRGTCSDFRAVFAAAAASLGPAARRLWIDIEDDEAVLGAVDVEDFPALVGRASAMGGA